MKTETKHYRPFTRPPADILPNQKMKEAIISTERINSYGSRVLTAGIDLTQYEKNPVLLYMHRRYGREDIPIGIMTNLRVEDGVLYGTPKFDEDTEEEKIIAAKWERGTLRMLSAGLDVLEWSEDPAVLTPGQTRPTVTKSKLIEVSVVDIGSNDDALQVDLYHGGELLKLAAGEPCDHLPLLKTEPEKTIPNNTNKNDMKTILLALGLAATATAEEAVAAITQLQNERNALQEERENLNLARITDAVEGAITEKRITADKKEKYLNLGKQVGLDSLKELLGDIPAAQKPLDLVRPAGGNKPEHVALTWKTATEAQLKDLRDNDRAEYIRLFKEEYGTEPTF